MLREEAVSYDFHSLDLMYIMQTAFLQFKEEHALKRIGQALSSEATILILLVSYALFLCTSETRV